MRELREMINLMPPGSVSDISLMLAASLGSQAKPHLFGLGPIAEDRSQSPPSEPPSRVGLAKPAVAGVEQDPGGSIRSSSSRVTSDSSSRVGTSAIDRYSDLDEVSPVQAARPNAPSLVTLSSSKSGKWGFLRKMSTNKLRSEKKSPVLSSSASANLRMMPPPLTHTISDPSTRPMYSRPGMNSTQSAMTLSTRKATSPDETPIEKSGNASSVLRSPDSSTLPVVGLPSVSSLYGGTGGLSTVRGKRRSFLPIDGPPSINIAIPSLSPFMPNSVIFESREASSSARAEEESEDTTLVDTSDALVTSPTSDAIASPTTGIDPDIRYASGLESIKSYLRDLFDLSRPAVEPYGGFEVLGGTEGGPGVTAASSERHQFVNDGRALIAEARRNQRPDLDSGLSRNESQKSVSGSTRSSMAETAETSWSGKKFKNDRSKRTKVIREIYEYVYDHRSKPLTSRRTERTYVRGLGELVSIYVKPASQLVNPGKGQTETMVPAAERKIVFGGIESILTIHRDNLLPSLERVIRTLLEGADDDEGTLSAKTAHNVGEVFRTYIAYMKQYSTYINSFDNALSRMKMWIAPTTAAPAPALSAKPMSPTTSAVASAAVSVGMGMSSVSIPLAESVPHTGSHMTASQRKRVKVFLKVSLRSFVLFVGPLTGNSGVENIPCTHRSTWRAISSCQYSGFRDTSFS